MFRFLSIFISSIVRRWVFIVFGNRAQMFLLFPHSRIISARTRWYAARQLSTQSQFSGNVGTGRTITGLLPALARGTWHVSRPASFKLNNTADACPASCVHLPIRQAQAQTRARIEHSISWSQEQATPAR